ncbi:calcium/sodium antiporter [Mangrovibacter yixingensis]|uniref:calcium/sodium antiporter n=1 Tax=Mangrovibacter yixingensis TaxID=1529639 RepID=UPI001CFD3A2B|nr:calcium/sodium antiporter [Mangrovibacter yixingensis]
MFVATSLLIIGLLLVVYSADRLVFSASLLCHRLGLSPLIIGMTVVTVGTSLPEIIVALSATLRDQGDLAVGTAIGSNITNILLILGLAATLHPLKVHSGLLRREIPLMLLVTLVAGYILWDGELTRGEGVTLLIMAAIYLLLTVKFAQHAHHKENDNLTREQLAELPCEGSLPVAFLWLGVALIIMPIATHMVIDNATVLANAFNISEFLVGVTVLAIGTSLPELATAIAGSRKGEDNIAIGNLIGANIFNITIVLGLPALGYHSDLDPLMIRYDYGVLLLVSFVFALLCWRRSGEISKCAGALLLAGFILWLIMRLAGFFPFVE